MPFEERRLKVADEDRPKRKTYPFDKVVEFIRHAKASGSREACFYGALVTTYGFRPIEIARITQENINQEYHQISAQTAKHGRLRIHHIPEAIRPYLYSYHSRIRSDKHMTRLWKRICRDINWRPQAMIFRGKEDTEGIGYNAYHGYGWYGMRHAVFTNLVDRSEIHPVKPDKWGGWRTGQVSGAGMVSIYHAPDTASMQAIDLEILAKHPFVGYWDGNK